MPSATRVPLSGPAGPPAEAALELAGVGAWEVDLATGALAASGLAAELCGVPAPSLRSFHQLVDAVHPEDRGQLQEAAAGLRGGARPFALDLRVRRPDGTTRWVHARGKASRHEGRDVMVGTVQDITDRKDVERAGHEAARLREMNEFKARFINVAAHELKTPITPMRLQLAILREVDPSNLREQQTRALAVLQRNLDRLAALVEDVLQAARIQAHNLKLAVKPLDLGRLVREVGEDFQEGARQAGIALEVQSDAGIVVEVDPVRIQQVVSNLVTNAVKFTPEGGTVSLRARREGGQAVVSVRDTGIGMTRDQLARLFEPFVQVHDRPSERLRGTGLGLYISRGILEQHKGGIAASSEGAGRGSTFEFWLPLSDKPVDVEAAPPKPTAAKRFRELI